MTTVLYSAKVWWWKTLTNDEWLAIHQNLYLLMYVSPMNPQLIQQSFTCQTFVDDSFVKVFPH